MKINNTLPNKLTEFAMPASLKKEKAKTAFALFIIIGYIVGTLYGYSKLKDDYVTKYYCVSTAGPRTCQPEEDCDRECLKWEPKLETRQREAFYTYGLLGAFLGAWVAVFVVTYILKE